MEVRNKTRDLWFCVFLKLKGYTMVDFIKNDSEKIDFIFDIPNVDWKKLKLEFNNSDISKAKWEMEKIKDLIFQ